MPLRLATSIVLALSTACALAQAPSAVQLPTWQQFSVQTSVLVPDGGTSVIGGVGGAASSRRSTGPSVLGPQRFSGRSLGTGMVSIHAQVHDMAELDRQTLSAADQSQASVDAATVGDQVLLGVAPPAGSVAEMRALHAAELAAREAEAARYIVLAREALDQHKPSVARLYYQMALRRASGPAKAEIVTQLRALSAATADASSGANASTPK